VNKDEQKIGFTLAYSTANEDVVELLKLVTECKAGLRSAYLPEHDF
jgi:hypothetical protein